MKLNPDTHNYLKAKYKNTITTLDENPNIKIGWNLSNVHRANITDYLITKQKGVCLYCQDRINPGNYHIEHFIERHDNPKLTYEISNMLMSCEGGRFKNFKTEDFLDRITRVPSISCGHYKTRNFHNAEIDYTLIINPMKEVFSEYFEYKEGYIHPKHGLPKEKQAKAAYTIERLNLNSLRLVHERNKTLEALMIYLNKYRRSSSKKGQLTKMLCPDNKIYPKFRDMLLDKIGIILT